VSEREYDAVLPDSEQCDRYQSKLIYKPIHEALKRHHLRNRFRFHRHYFHMASSQAACINLFLPILVHPRASEVLRRVKPDFDTLATDHLDKGFCLEFWGGNFPLKGVDPGKGPLKDKSEAAGTDADIAIAYRTKDGELRLWLVEHKLTESEFTACGGFKSKGRNPQQHDCTKSMREIVAGKDSCYYHSVRRFGYWDLMQEHAPFFAGAARVEGCPFKGGTNQLWRNQLMALAIERDEQQPYEVVDFTVLRHPGNTALDPSIQQYIDLVRGSPRFSVLASNALVEAAEATGDADLSAWAAWYRGLYNLPAKATATVG
jgi:hypothetical protein